MKAPRNSTIGICLALLVGLFATVASAQPPAGPNGAGPNGFRGGFGARGGRGFGANNRVQMRSYVLTNTGEMMPYAVFVSSKVNSNTPAPLIVALHGLGGTPRTLVGGTALQLAEAGGYILVGPEGYNSSGWYGMPTFGGRGGRRGAPTAGTNNQAAAPFGRGGQLGGRGGGFGAVTGGTNVTDQAKVRELSEIDVMNVLAIVRTNFNVDENRVYLMGHSMGGGGALYLGEKYATNWAAIAALAPAAFGIQPNSLAKIRDMPVLLVQGAADTTVQPAMTRRWGDELKALHMTGDYKEIPGVDHGGVISAGMPDVFDFFAKHTKGEAKPAAAAP